MIGGIFTSFALELLVYPAITRCGDGTFESANCFRGALPMLARIRVKNGTLSIDERGVSTRRPARSIRATIAGVTRTSSNWNWRPRGSACSPTRTTVEAGRRPQLYLRRAAARTSWPPIRCSRPGSTSASSRAADPAVQPLWSVPVKLRAQSPARKASWHRPRPHRDTTARQGASRTWRYGDIDNSQPGPFELTLTTSSAHSSITATGKISTSSLRNRSTREIQRTLEELHHE